MKQSHNQLPTQVSQSTKRRNPHLFGGGEGLTVTQVMVEGKLVDVAPMKLAEPKLNVARKPRKSVEERLNKTERRWLELLKARDKIYHYSAIRIQAVTLRLANGVRYTPDFNITQLNHAEQRLEIIMVEVKGAFVREDAWIKLKTAASLFPEYKFIMAQWKDGLWHETVIQP